MNKLSATLMAGIAGAALVLAGSPAGASTTKGPAPASPHISSNPPAGYVVVSSGSFLAANGVQSHGTVTCPGTELPSGGGAIVQSSALTANLNSTYPFGQSWAVDVNNTSGSDTTFTVYAICIKATSTYTVVTQQESIDTGVGEAPCPIHRVAIGGGVLSSSSLTGININGNYPVGGRPGWAALMTNSTTDHTSTFTVYAICRAKPKGFTFGGTSNVNIPPGTEVNTVPACPGASRPLSGGGVPNTLSPGIDINSSFPTSTGWSFYENNATAGNVTMGASVVCAGT